MQRTASQLNSFTENYRRSPSNISRSTSLLSTTVNEQYHFMTSSDQFPVPVRSAVKSNFTNWYCQNSSKHASNALTVQASTTELGSRTTCTHHYLPLSANTTSSWVATSAWAIQITQSSIQSHQIKQLHRLDAAVFQQIKKLDSGWLYLSTKTLVLNRILLLTLVSNWNFKLKLGLKPKFI